MLFLLGRGSKSESFSCLFWRLKNRSGECSKHKKIKNLFCERCQVLMCLKCIHSHTTTWMTSIYNKLREIQSSLQIRKLMKHLNLMTQSEKLKRKAKQNYRTAIDILVALRSKESLLKDADAATCQKLELHSLERAELETVLVRLKSCKEFVQETLKSRSRYQIQTAKKELVQRIKDAHSEVKVSELQPGQNADTAYVRKHFTLSPPDVGSVKGTLNYRSVHGLFSVDIPQCVLHGVTTEVSLMTSLLLSVKLVQCKMKSIHSGEATSCTVKQVNEGHFKVLLNPDLQPGLH